MGWAGRLKVKMSNLIEDIIDTNSLFMLLISSKNLKHWACSDSLPIHTIRDHLHDPTQARIALPQLVNDHASIHEQNGSGEFSLLNNQSRRLWATQQAGQTSFIAIVWRDACSQKVCLRYFCDVRCPSSISHPSAHLLYLKFGHHLPHICSPQSKIRHALLSQGDQWGEKGGIWQEAAQLAVSTH
jgi:hypothetical protein